MVLEEAVECYDLIFFGQKPFIRAITSKSTDENIKNIFIFFNVQMKEEIFIIVFFYLVLLGIIFIYYFQIYINVLPPQEK